VGSEPKGSTPARSAKNAAAAAARRVRAQPESPYRPCHTHRFATKSPLRRFFVVSRALVLPCRRTLGVRFSFERTLAHARNPLNLFNKILNSVAYGRLTCVFFATRTKSVDFLQKTLALSQIDH